MSKVVVATNAEIENLLNTKYTDGTKKQTKYAYRTFMNFMEQSESTDLLTDLVITPEKIAMLDEALSRFYASLRNMSRNSLYGIRYGCSK